MADLRQPTCVICGWRATWQWARYLYLLALHGIPKGHRFAGMVVKCEECSTGDRAVIVPFWFTEDVLAWAIDQEEK